MRRLTLPMAVVLAFVGCGPATEVSDDDVDKSPQSVASPNASARTPSVDEAESTGEETITGTVRVTEATGNGQYGPDAVKPPDSPCVLNSRSNGYDDLHRGAQITVRDENGTIVGVGELEESRFVDTHTEHREAEPAVEAIEGSGRPAYEQLWGYCEWPFAVRELPTAPFYSVEVGHRGEVQLSIDQLRDKDWTLSLEIGD